MQQNETNIPLFQFQMMYLNYFLNKIVQRIKNLFSKKTLCKYNNNNNINWTVRCCGSHHHPGNYSDPRG